MGRAQAIALGETYDSVAGRLARGEWDEPARGALRLVGVPDVVRRRLWAAQVSVGAPMALTGLAAAGVHGLAGIPECSVV